MKTQSQFSSLRRLGTLAVLAGSLLPWSGRAALDPADLPADAQWVVYADVAGMRDSTLGQEIIKAINAEQGELELDDVRINVSEVLATLGSIIAYGDNLSENPEEMDGALVLRGSDKMRTIAEGLAAHASLSEPDAFKERDGLPYDAYEVHGEVLVAFPEEPVVIVSRSVERIDEALALLRRNGPSLKGRDTELSRMLPQADPYFLFASSLMPANMIGNDNEPHARVLLMAKSAAVQVGETDGQVTVAGNFVTADSDTAEKMHKILNGLVAVLSLAESKDADLVAFINSVKVTRDQNKVGLRMAYETEAVMRLADAHLNREEHAEEVREERRRERFHIDGIVVDEWVADQNLGSDQPTEQTLVVRDLGAVELNPGDRVILAAMFDHGEAARYDWLELTPAGMPDATQRYEAEYLRLNRYLIQEAEAASGGELIRMRDGHGRVGQATLMFTGAPGTYQMKVRYADEDDGQVLFKVVVAPKETAE